MTAAPSLLAGTAAMRNTKRGSWYVEALRQVFSERACDMHVADMLVQVSGPAHLGASSAALPLPVVSGLPPGPLDLRPSR